LAGDAVPPLAAQLTMTALALPAVRVNAHAGRALRLAHDPCRHTLTLIAFLCSPTA
jgi:hypothetical protein